MVAPQAGGLLLAAGLGVNSNFLVFTLAAVVAGALLWMCPRPAHRSRTEPQEQKQAVAEAS